MKKCINDVTIVGYVYQHSLERKTVKDPSSKNYGKEFIGGTLEVATDEQGLNVIPVHYTFVTPLTKNGQDNRMFGVLASIIDHPEYAWINGGKDSALKVRCSTSFGTNDFYGKDGTLVTQLIQKDGFISTVNELPAEDRRNMFSLDFLITNVTRVEADLDNNILADYCNVRGAGFDFRGTLLPMTLTVHNPQGIDYFEGLDASNSNPVFTKVYGIVNNSTVNNEVNEETAFGTVVRSSRRRAKEWVITAAAPHPYEFGDESVMTFEDVQKAIQDREVYLATVKKRADDYQAAKAAGTAAPAQPTVQPKPSTAIYNF